MKLSCFYSSLVMLLALSPLSAFTVEEGQRLRLKYPQDAPQVLAETAQDFARIFSLATGTETTAHRGGWGASLHLIIDPWLDEDHKGPTYQDHIRYRVTQDSIEISGNDAHATALAAYAFLRERLGVRWYFPGAEGEYIPTGASIQLSVAPPGESPTGTPRPQAAQFPPPSQPSTIPAVRQFGIEDTVFQPGFHCRAIYGIGVSPEARRWALRNGLRQRYAYNHNLRDLVSESVRQANPVYTPQPDLDDPAIREAVVERARLYFESHPYAPSHSVALNDSFIFGDERVTRELLAAGHYFQDWLDYSDHSFSFTNAVAAALEEEYPDRRIGQLAYLTWRNLPSFSLHRNVLPVLTVDRTQWWDPLKRDADRRLMQSWVRDSGAEVVGTWDYHFGNGYLYPRGLRRAVATTIPELARQGVQVYFCQSSPVWAWDWPRIWLQAQLLWRPEAGDVGSDGPSAWHEALAFAYGSHAPQVAAFQELMEGTWENQGRRETANEPPSRVSGARWLRYWREPYQVVLMPDEVVAEADAILGLTTQGRDSNPSTNQESNTGDSHCAERRFAELQSAWQMSKRLLAHAQLVRELNAVTVSTPHDIEPVRAKIVELEAREAELMDIRDHIPGVEQDVLHQTGYLQWGLHARPQHRLRGEITEMADRQEPGTWGDSVRATAEPHRPLVPVTRDAGLRSFGFPASPWITQIVPTEGLRIEQVDAQTGGVRISGCRRMEFAQVFEVEPSRELRMDITYAAQLAPACRVRARLEYFDGDKRMVGVAPYQRLVSTPARELHGGISVVPGGHPPVTQARLRFTVFEMEPGDWLELRRVGVETIPGNGEE